ncbi:MAG TPA: ABC-F family ATP-binding cassette domain-containing protein [Tepidiformaceae bacterium]|nr:ABC-F family ATP-binding cassette domain-containing protein [Tepidiformaceae bacterium]
MLTVESLAKELGGRSILTSVSFSLERGEVAGVVGPNGSGKTTLLRLIAGDLIPDGGRVVLPPGATVVRLAQGYAGESGAPVADLFPACFPQALEPRLVELAERMAAEDEATASAAADEYDALIARVRLQPAGFDLPAAWDALALRDISAVTPAGTLSGGELTKLGLLNAFAAAPDVLLLDEPTNHLDLGGMEWLEAQLEEFRGAALVVSHDRVLLDNVADEVLELDPRTGMSEVFAGGYTEYAEEKARRHAEQWAAYERQQREERKLKKAISAIESRSRNIENRTIHFYFRKRAKKVARRAVTLKARLDRELESAGHVDRPGKQAQGFYGAFTAGERSAGRILGADGLALEVADRRLFERLTFEVRRGERVALLGPNGSGKTTLIRAILGEQPVAEGELFVSGSARMGYLAQDDPAHAAAGEDGALTPVALLRRSIAMSEPEVNDFLHRFLFGHSQLGTPIARLSYGERRRLELARLVLSGANLLLLDEPTNHLDLPSREAFESAFSSFDGAALVVTHDRHFIERFADRVVELPG